MKQNEESVQAKSTKPANGATTAKHQVASKPRRLSNRELEAAYAIGGDCAMRSASKASYRAKPCERPQTEKAAQRHLRWMLLGKHFDKYVAVQIAAANDLLKGPVKANLSGGIAAAEALKFDHDVLLKDAVKLVKGRWALVRYVVEAIKTSPELWLGSASGGARGEIQWI